MQRLELDRLNRRHTFRAIALMAVFYLIVPMVAAASGYEEMLAEMFLGESRTPEPNELLFMIVLPFLIVFGLLFYFSKQVLDDGPEAFIIALSISLFLIYADGYIIIHDLFTAIFGAGSGGLSDYGFVSSSGEVSPDQLLQDMRDMSFEYKVLITLLVGAFSTVLLNHSWFGGNRDFGAAEFAMTLVFMLITWLMFAGLESIQTIGFYFLLFMIAFTLLGVPLKTGGFIAKVIGLVGLGMIGWILTTFPDEALTDSGLSAPDIGQTIVNIISGIAGGIIVLVLIALMFLYAHAKSN